MSLLVCLFFFNIHNFSAFGMELGMLFTQEFKLKNSISPTWV